MTHEQAVSEFAKLILRYGLRWNAEVPAEAYAKMSEVSKHLSIDEKLQILRS